MTVTLDCGAVNVNCFFGSVVDFTGYDTGAPVGVTGTDAALAVNGADSVTLSAAPASTSIIFGGRIGAVPGSGTVNAAPDTGHVETHDLNLTDNSGVQTQTRAGSTSTAFGWADISNGTAGDLVDVIGLAIEIKAAASGSTVNGVATATFGGTFTAVGVPRTPGVAVATLAGTFTAAGVTGVAKVPITSVTRLSDTTAEIAWTHPGDAPNGIAIARALGTFTNDGEDRPPSDPAYNPLTLVEAALIATGETVSPYTDTDTTTAAHTYWLIRTG
jgi:hypothetical protein